MDLSQSVSWFQLAVLVHQIFQIPQASEAAAVRRLSGSIARNTPSAKPLTSNGFLFRTKPGSNRQFGEGPKCSFPPLLIEVHVDQ